ncbi:MAG: hypothetical protein JXB04_07775 [Kiritimatiellae bacterium]|nr:hypothetical protein [Kiritimatiellia bacterium]
MNCARFRKSSITYADGFLPDDLAAHMAACDACRAFYEKGESLRRLLALKRYERRDAVRAAATRATIHQVLVEEAYKEQAAPAAEPAGALVAALPFLRYGLAAALVALLGFHALLISPLSSVQSDLPEALTPVRTASPSRPQPVVVRDAPAAAYEPLMLASSNIGPARIQYGTVPSVLTSFGE